VTNTIRLAIVVSLLQATAAVAADPSTERPMAKVSVELRELYESYLTAQKSGAPLRSPNPLVRVVDGRVVIDAVAAADVAELRADLVGLGLQHAVAAGRIVSGQLPVSAIAAMATLPSLRLARAAMATTRGTPQRGVR
jgi:hypothetical protein